jgi:hypothetical protein
LGENTRIILNHEPKRRSGHLKKWEYFRGHKGKTKDTHSLGGKK